MKAQNCEVQSKWVAKTKSIYIFLNKSFKIKLLLFKNYFVGSKNLGDFSDILVEK